MCAGSILWGYLYLSHLHRAPGLGPRWGSWQHLLAPRRGCILVHIDFKMPLSCSVGETASKRSIFNLREELSLNGSELKSSLLLLKNKQKLKKEGKVSFPVLVLHLQDLSCSGLCEASCVGHTCDMVGTGTACGRAGLCSPCPGVAEFSCF